MKRCKIKMENRTSENIFFLNLCFEKRPLLLAKEFRSKHRNVVIFYKYFKLKPRPYAGRLLRSLLFVGYFQLENEKNQRENDELEHNQRLLGE